MRIYITATFKGEENKSEIEHLCHLVREAGFEDFCFIRDVENYTKMFDDSNELMQRAKDEIAASDALLIDMTEKSTGRTLEAGIAFALEKKVVVIAKRGSRMKDTVKGVAALIIEYDTIDDIMEPLRSWLSTTRL